MPNDNRPNVDDVGKHEPVPGPNPEPGWRNTLRRPTFWVLMLALAGFLYLQWPTRVQQEPTPDYVSVEPFEGVQMTWEAPPERSEGEAGPVWSLSREGMEFLAQRGPLNRPFPELARQMVETDREVGSGAGYEPLSIDRNRADYALFDAANRIQRHHLYRLGDQWFKVSVLYKAQSEAQQERAGYFLNSVEISAP